MEILASWHRELAKRKDPVVILIEDIEHYRFSVLAEVINRLSEWVMKIPVFLVIGMETTVDDLRKLQCIGKIGEFMSIFVNAEQQCGYVSLDCDHAYRLLVIVDKYVCTNLFLSHTTTSRP